MYLFVKSVPALFKGLSSTLFLQESLLQGVLGKASNTLKLLLKGVRNHYELCLAKCRTSSEVIITKILGSFSVIHTYGYVQTAY